MCSPRQAVVACEQTPNPAWLLQHRSSADRPRHEAHGASPPYPRTGLQYKAGNAHTSPPDLALQRAPQHRKQYAHTLPATTPPERAAAVTVYPSPCAKVGRGIPLGAAKMASAWLNAPLKYAHRQHEDTTTRQHSNPCRHTHTHNDARVPVIQAHIKVQYHPAPASSPVNPGKAQQSCEGAAMHAQPAAVA